MSFITKQELKTIGIPEVIDMITGANDTIVDDIIAETVAIMAGYVGAIYDAPSIFAETGSSRNLTLVKYAKDIAIYEIYIRQSKAVNEVALIRYDRAMKELDKISKGQVNLSLPYASGGDEDGDGEQDGELFFNSGNQRYQNRF